MNAEIETLDKELSAKSTPLDGRPIAAYWRLVETFGTPGLPFEPFGTELFQEIRDWYSRRYGQKMNPEIKAGEKPVLIRGVIFFMRFPVGYGPRQMDIFRQIQGMTPQLLASLSPKEQDEIAEVFKRGYAEVVELVGLDLSSPKTTPEIQEIISRGLEDLAASIVILKDSGDAQKAIVESHAASEKFMKAAFATLTGDTLDNVRRNRAFGGKGHDLQKGLRALESVDARFSAVRTQVAKLHLPDMNIRYEEQSYNIADAVSAVDASHAVCAFVCSSVLR